MVDKIEFTEEQQAFVDKLVGDARVKARDKAATDAQAQTAKDREAAEQTALIAEKQWQKLAGKHEARVKELEPFEASAKEYDKLVATMLKDKIEALGEEAKKAIDGLPEAMSVIDKLNWLNKNEALFQVAGDGVGTPGRPRQKSGKKKAADVGHRRMRL